MKFILESARFLDIWHQCSLYNLQTFENTCEFKYKLENTFSKRTSTTQQNKTTLTVDCKTVVHLYQYSN